MVWLSWQLTFSQSLLETGGTTSDEQKPFYWRSHLMGKRYWPGFSWDLSSSVALLVQKTKMSIAALSNSGKPLDFTRVGLSGVPFADTLKDSKACPCCRWSRAIAGYDTKLRQ